MANVYSALLWSIDAPAGTHNSDPVPAGYVWVIKDICVTFGDSALDTGSAFLISAGVPTVPIFARAIPELVTANTYHWWGMQVVEAGDTITLISTDVSTQVRISGYVLTLP